METTLSKLLTVKEAALTRRSIRKYKPDPIPQAHLEEILSLALLAPSAWNAQPWRYVVVREVELKEKLREAANNQAQVSLAPAVIVQYADMVDTLEHAEEIMHPNLPEENRKTRANGIRQSFASRSTQEAATWGAGQNYIALGYLMLLAQSYGYSTVPMLGFNQAKVKELLGLPEHVAISALLPIGIADEEGHPHHRHSLERVVRWS